MSIERQHKIVSTILAAFLGLFFLYAFWYQYAYAPIGIALPLMGGGILILSLCNIRLEHGYYRELAPVLVFVAYVASFGLLVSHSIETSRNYIVNICKYLIPMLGVYVYVDSDYRKFIRVLKILTFSVMLICVSSLTSGHVTNTGAIIVGSLNANVESSFLALGVISAMLIISYSETKHVEKAIVVAAVLLFIKTQIDCASRRGFVVLLFLIVASVLVIVQTRYKDNKVVKWLILLAIICSSFVVISTLSETLAGSVLIERFGSAGNEGDLLRKVYQAKALQLFLNEPIFGTGLGYVAVAAGMYSHSMYYELLACTGIIGTGIVVGSLMVDIVRFFSYSRIIEDSNDDLIICAKCMMFFVLAILLGGFAVVYIYDMYFYVILGLIAAACKVIRTGIE